MMPTAPVTPSINATRPKTLPVTILLLMGLSLLAPVACGHEQHKRPNVNAARYKPTAFPDRVVLTWPDDPRRSMSVTWRTDVATTKGVVQHAPAASLVGNLRTGDVPHYTTAEASLERLESDAGPMNYHSGALTGLEPATMYAYRVGDGQHWSEWHQFRTAADAAEPFSFVYFGDAQNAVRSLWSRVVREANQHAPRAGFMLHAGDLINNANRDLEWAEWFEAAGWLNGMIPVVATPGNHEYSLGKKKLSRYWRPQFAFPRNGPTGLEETAYWFDYQGARIISLDSNARLEAQKPWLQSVLQDPQRPKWTFVTFHHPIYSAAKDRDNGRIRDLWRTILEENGVDLVLTGHDHAYARSGLGGPANLTKNLPGGVRTKSSNTVYVVSVSGPKQYPLQETWDMSRIAAGVQLFQVIRVSQDRLQYEARLATGELYDAFDLLKNEQGVSTLEEHTPKRPELRIE